MKVLVAVLSVLAVVSAAPSDQQQVDIAKTARQMQSIGHMAVVDTISPLHVAVSTLVSKIDKLQHAASKQQIRLPQIDVPQVDMIQVFTCQSQAVPKFTVALQYIAQKSSNLQATQQQAMRLASGLDYVVQKVNQKDIDNDTLQAVASKLNQFLGSYASLLYDAVNVICNTSRIQQTQSNMASPLSVFY